MSLFEDREVDRRFHRAQWRMLFAANKILTFTLHNMQ